MFVWLVSPSTILIYQLIIFTLMDNDIIDLYSFFIQYTYLYHVSLISSNSVKWHVLIRIFTYLVYIKQIMTGLEGNRQIYLP